MRLPVFKHISIFSYFEVIESLPRTFFFFSEKALSMGSCGNACSNISILNDKLNDKMSRITAEMLETKAILRH